MFILHGFRVSARIFLLLAEFNAENLKTLKTSVEVIEVFDILEGCFYKVDVVNWVNMVYIGCLK
jgi:hypothetical protein